MQAKNFIYSVVVALGAAGTAGCEEPVVEESVELREGGDKPTCPVWQCGFNSAEVNGRAIRELNLDGLANDDGMKIVGFIAPAGLLGGYKLDVENDALIARNSQGKVLRGAQLLGSTILVKDPSLLGLPLPIIVAGYQEIPSWAAGAPKVATYALVYVDLKGLLGMRNVCNGDLLDTLATAATVLGGETYDLETKTVEPDRDRWLTIACAGSAAAKLRLLGYGPQSDFDGEGNPATVEQRQSTLKMITADYCGDGTSYTANHTALQWENSEGTVQPAGQTGLREALWTAAGALCLDHPRIPGTTVDCDLPACGDLELPAGEWLTHVPN